MTEEIQHMIDVFKRKEVDDEILTDFYKLIDEYNKFVVMMDNTFDSLLSRIENTSK